MEFIKKNLLTICVLILVSAAYFFVFFKVPKTVFWSPDGGGKYIYMYCMGNTPEYELFYLGKKNDPDFLFYPNKLDITHKLYPVSIQLPQQLSGGKVQFHWSIWIPIISKFISESFGEESIFLIPLLSGFFLIIVISLIVKSIFQPAVPYAIAAIGMGTPVFFYSLNYWEHIPALCFSFLVVYLFSIRDKGIILYTVAIILLVISTMLRIELFFLSVSILFSKIVVLMKYNEKKITNKNYFVVGLCLLLVIITISGVFLAFKSSSLTSEKSVSFINNILSIPGWRFIFKSFPETIKMLWVNSNINSMLGPIVPRWMTWIGLIGVILCFISIVFRQVYRRWIIMIGGILIVAVSLYVLYMKNPFESIHSIFLISPWLVFAPLITEKYKNEEYSKVKFLWNTSFIYLILGSMAVVINALSHPYTRGTGGLEWGPRYILAIFPLLGICAAIGICRYTRENNGRLRNIILTLFIVSSVLGAAFQIRGLKQMITKLKVYNSWQKRILNTRKPVVTNEYLLSTVLAHTFIKQEFYTLDSVTKLYVWLKKMDGKIKTFQYISKRPLSKDFIAKSPIKIIPLKIDCISGMYFIDFDILL
ncbi:hypothetical protein KAJ27_04215 [bacterium]|nr:hypothetical protein [bacterium]